MAIVFNGPTKHGTMTFEPTTVMAFEDTMAEAYFVAAGFAKASTKRPTVTHPAGTVEIDINTQFGTGPNRGAKVMGS